MSRQVNEDEVLEALGSLSPRGKREVLRRLIGDLDEFDRMVDRNRERLRAICRERGLDFSSLSEEEKEALIDRMLHEE
jgi:hypothetical protein